ncbi:MAG: BON domain-containing protein [Deltaproteobacteria bacterium]|nr:BON domain-containing protein [Deltaproteobacteria bacterium]
MFKTYLKGDDIKIESKDGVVTLTGSVSEESHKSLAQEDFPWREERSGKDISILELSMCR